MSLISWLDKGLDIAKVVTSGTPIGAVVTVIDSVVDEIGEGVSDKSVKEVIFSMSKSKWNKLDDEKVKRINKILDEE